MEPLLDVGGIVLAAALGVLGGIILEKRRNRAEMQTLRRDIYLVLLEGLHGLIEPIRDWGNAYNQKVFGGDPAEGEQALAVVKEAAAAPQAVMFKAMFLAPEEIGIPLNQISGLLWHATNSSPDEAWSAGLNPANYENFVSALESTVGISLGIWPRFGGVGRVRYTLLHLRRKANGAPEEGCSL